MVDEFSARYGDLLTGSYDCVDRIVLNAYSLGNHPGGFRVWWRRWHDDGDASLDNAHLMRLAGRFARRVRAWAGAHGVPVIDCKADERKHRIAEEYLREHTVGVGVFLILVARAPATVWKVKRTKAGVIRNLDKTRQFVNHYSFHIMDPAFGHLTIKMSGHPPFGAQVILNGHEYAACQAQAAGIGFAKEGNCFTRIGDPERLAQIADTLSQPGTIGRLSQVIDRWIYTACLCFGLDIDEQRQSGFHPALAVLVDVEPEAQARGVDPPVDDLAQAPYRPRLGQGVCDLSQALGITNTGEAVALLREAYAGRLGLAGDVLVAVEDHLRPEGWMPTHLDRHVPEGRVHDVERVVVDELPGLVQVADHPAR